MQGRRFQTRLQQVAALGASLALLNGCETLTGVNSSSTLDWETQTNLSAAYGGYEFKAEAQAFGDAEVRLLDSEERAISVADLDTLPTPNAFVVRILWGQLQGNREAEATLTWDGAFAVSSGGVSVLRAIAFEPRTDRVLRRTNRQIVEFRSQTRPHFDGLLLMIHDIANDPNATLSMRTGPYSATWSFEELRAADMVVRVDDLGNAVSVAALERPGDPAGCPSGAMRGHWQVRDGERGVFRALWVSRLGQTMGHVRGHFGVNDEGQNVWFAKIIGRGGEVIGLARGTYAPSDDPAVEGGSFSGHWAARAGERSGVIEGHYLPGRTGRDGAAGFLHARWKANCDGAGNDMALPGE